TVSTYRRRPLMTSISGADRARRFYLSKTSTLVRDMRQGSPPGERGYEAQQSPAVTLDGRPAPKTIPNHAGPPGPASLRIGLPISVRPHFGKIEKLDCLQ